MAIKGSLREASMPDVLQLLSMGKKTGCLGVTHRGNFGYIYFNDGRISHASIVNRPDRIGDLLVKDGTINQGQLQEAVVAQEKQRDRRLGDLLVELGHVKRDVLHDHVRVQIEEAVYQLFTWNDGTFNFEVGVRPEPHELLVSITPESLLLEGARRVDEWSVIEKKIPSFDMVFEADWAKLAAKDLDLTPEQRTVLQHLDGRRDIAHVADASGLGEFDAGKAFYGLLTAGLIHRTGNTTKTHAPVSSARLDEHRNLGVAFYRSSMYEESMREFRRVLEISKDDPRGLFYSGLILLRQGEWAAAVDAYQGAVTRPDARAGTFHNLAIALERVGRYADALVAVREAHARGGATDAKMQTSLGVLLLLTGDIAGADAALAAAKGLWRSHPSAAWYHYAGLSAASLGDLPRAQAILKEGIGHHPHAAVLYNNLAAVLERRGAHEEALDAGEEGRAEDPTLPQLHKNIGDLYYRAGRYDEAFEAFERAVRVDANLGGDLHLKIGNIRLRRGQRAEAASSWQRALVLDPDNTIARNNLETLKRTAG
jgi:tetratricopeptide (TPR) repeat protein